MLATLNAAAFAHGNEKHRDAAPEAIGAPASASVSEAPAATTATTATTVEPPKNEVVAASTVLQNLHPATVHFPVALLLVAALAELLAAARGSASLAAAARVMGVAGGIGACVAALFGWIHTGIWLGGGSTMQAHRWVGTALGIAGLAVAWAGWRQRGGRTMFRALLFAAALAVLVQGYLGGELSHGAGHLWK